MKKVFLTLAIAATLTTGAFAVGSTKNTIADTKVSYTVQHQFDSEFRDAEHVSWSNTSNGLKADFVMNDVKMSAFYNKVGYFIGYTEDVTFKTLPAPAKKQIAAQYQGYFATQTMRFQGNDSPSAYERLTAGDDQSSAYYVNLANDKEEVLLKVTSHGDVSVYKQVK